jgi:hypothetical protein
MHVGQKCCLVRYLRSSRHLKHMQVYADMLSVTYAMVYRAFQDVRRIYCKTCRGQAITRRVW